MQVLELGQVGKAGTAQGQNYSFYAHSQREAPFGDAAGIVKALQHAAKHAGHMNVSGVCKGLPHMSFQGYLEVHLPVPQVVTWRQEELQDPLLFMCVLPSCCGCSSNTMLTL